MRKGDIVELTFLDHAQNTKKPIEFTVWGRVVEFDKLSIALQTWGYPDSLECSNQTEGYVIVKSCLTKPVRVLHFG